MLFNLINHLWRWDSTYICRLFCYIFVFSCSCDCFLFIHIRLKCSINKLFNLCFSFSSFWELGGLSFSRCCRYHHRDWLFQNCQILDYRRGFSWFGGGLGRLSKINMASSPEPCKKAVVVAIESSSSPQWAPGSTQCHPFLIVFLFYK